MRNRLFSPLRAAPASRAPCRLRYAVEFDHKWLRGGAPAGEPLIGSADIQALADLSNSFDAVNRMRLAPFTFQNVLQLTVVTLLPVVPLMLTMFLPDQLFDQALRTVF